MKKTLPEMMNIRQAYDSWAEQYDSNQNKTRDLESHSLRETLANQKFSRCLEIGCGTGKNTKWLIEQVDTLTAVDFSNGMLEKARKNVNSKKVSFIHADINQPWHFSKTQYDLVTFSLVLEHIEDLNAVFEKVSKSCDQGAIIYISELHPFKQYNGSKARYESENGTQLVKSFTHHISEFINAARAHGISVKNVKEYFDDVKRTSLPRLITFLFQKD